jgi:hypothetical protein
MDLVSQLKQDVERFEVCWESFPELSGANHQRRAIGFMIELYGTHDRTDVVPTAGCIHCIPVLQALLQIAEFVVPDDWRDSLDALRAHSGIEYAKERGGRPDVVVAITMIPRREGDPDANAIARCLAGVKQRLEELGTCERSWRAEGGWSASPG